jgi:hypothetical protein
MRSPMWISELRIVLAGKARLAGRRDDQSNEKIKDMKVHQAVLPVLVIVALALLSAQGTSQSFSDGEDYRNSVESTTMGKLDLPYFRPTRATKVKNFTFDAFGPYAFVGGIYMAGIDQATKTPPEWKQGFSGYAERFGSDFGIAAAGTTTRYLLADAFRQDTLYYRCECSGIFPRLRHATISTLTGRSGEDGHRVFSVPALIAPYAGSMTAVYGWYPRRYGAMDAFRMGNYSLLESVGGNIALEFFYSGPHSLLSRMHFNNSHGSPIQGPNR